jgi:hypothetical protein
MSIVSEFIVSKKNEQLRNIEYFKSLSGVESKEAICKHIEEAKKRITLYDRLERDTKFKIKDIDYLIDINEYSEKHLNLLLEPCLEYYEFLDSRINEKHYDRDIKSLKAKQKEALRMIDPLFYTGELPQSPTMIREQLLSNLIAVGYESSYETIIESLPVGGKRKPKNFSRLESTKRSNLIQYSNGKVISLSITVKIPPEN